MSEPDRSEDPVTKKHSDTTARTAESAMRPFPMAPTSAEYTRGFEAIRDRLSDQQLELLRAHYHSVGYRASVHDLAHKCGIKSWRTVNRQYGEIAKWVLTGMGYDRPEAETVSLWLIGLVIGFDNMEMILRPEVVKALVQSGIVEANINKQPVNERSLISVEDIPAICPLKGVEGPETATTPNDFPTVIELVRALDRIRAKITPKQRAMLVLNYAARDRGVTMWELLQVCGTDIPDPKFAWSNYYDLAEMVFKELGFSKAEFDSLRASYWDLVLTECEPSDRDVMSGNYGMVFVIRPEVAEALERLRIVDNPDMAKAEMFEPSTTHHWETESGDSSSTMSEINDFIVYHNPDAMGPLSDDPEFRVFTNRGVSKANIGDRVWLITGEGNPRKYYLACWFYIDEFSSGEEEGFKHCIGGSEGRKFVPLFEIEQGEWFDRLKHDQGNFSFGFSRIITPGVVENLEAIEDRSFLGFLHHWMLEALERERNETPSVDAMAGSLFNAVSKTRATLHKFGAFIELDVDSWADEAKRLLSDLDILKGVDLATLRKLVSYIEQVSKRERSRPSEYWLELAWSGQLPIILGRLREVYRRVPHPELSRYIENSKASDAQPLRVHFLRSGRLPFLDRLGMVFAPGLSLDEDDAGRLQLGDLTSEDDIALIRLQVPADKAVPDSMTDVVTMAANFGKALRQGETVIVHCKDNQEFIILTAVCIVIAATDAKISASEAIELIREARPGVIVAETQEQFVSEFEKEWREVMAKRGDHYLLYWQERSVLDHAANEVPLDVVASNGLFGMNEGDTLWIVTLTQERELFLAGRLVVGEIVEHEEAMRRMPDAGLWQAEYYAFPEPGTEEFIRPLPLTEIAEELRFEGENDRLTVREGQINPQQLRKRRKLTRESAELVTSIWEESAPITDPEELVAAWQQVVEENPDDPQAHYNLGVALDEVGRSEEAVTEYQATIRLDPNYFPALYNLGNYLLHSQQFDEAIEMFNRAILVDGDYAPAHFMLGVAYFESGRFDDAVAATRQGLEIDPDDESAYYNIAYWTFLQGDYQGALARCDDVIAHFPFYTSPHVLKGICFKELGELDNEIQSYKNAIDIKVDDEGALIFNFTALFFLGAAWERKITGCDQGIEYIEADNHFDLQDPLHQFCMAMGHLAQGEREYADQWLEGLRTSAPNLARRLESALNYADLETSVTPPVRVDMFGGAQPGEGLQQDEISNDDRPLELEPAKPTPKSQPRKEIRLNVGGTEIVARHNPDLYLQVLKMLVETGALDNLELPISSGRKRNFLSRTPVHKDGSNFLAPVEYGGYYMESHSSRENGMRMLRAFLDDLGIESFVKSDKGRASVSVVRVVPPSIRERVLGSLLGMAACDALGTTAEFKPTGTFPAITAMIGGGPFGLKPGEWTDDTSMALCLADSLAECDGFDARDQMDRYLRWKNEGYLSSNGRAFDIGIIIRTALDKYERQSGEKNPYCGSISPAAAGNGSLMRLAPVPIYFANDPREAIRHSAESSRTTHGARECIDACRYFSGLLIGALEGKTKDEILSASFSPVPGLWESEPLSDRIANIANGAFKSKQAPEISGPGQGYVVLSLHAALWAFYHTRSFRDGALKVVNLGYDADTYGAIYGQLAGAYYGRSTIPSEWLAQLARLDIIEHLANSLIRSN